MLKKFKLGLFAFNASSGSTITNHKEKWEAKTDQIIKFAKEADNCGLDFLYQLHVGVIGVVNQDLTRILLKL